MTPRRFGLLLYELAAKVAVLFGFGSWGAVLLNPKHPGIAIAMVGLVTWGPLLAFIPAAAVVLAPLWVDGWLARRRSRRSR